MEQESGQPEVDRKYLGQQKIVKFRNRSPYTVFAIFDKIKFWFDSSRSKCARRQAQFGCKLEITTDLYDSLRISDLGLTHYPKTSSIWDGWKIALSK